MISINTNLAALRVLTDINNSDQNLQKSLERLSSGLRINSAKDDPGGLGVSMRLNAQIVSKGAAYNVVSDAVSLLETQDGVMAAAYDVLQRMAEISVLAQNAVLQTSDTTLYQTEYDQLTDELYGMLSEEFNGIALFANGGSTLTIYTSDNTSQTAALTIADMQSTVYDLVNGGDVTTTATADAVSSAIDALATLRATNGAQQSRFTRAADMLDINITNLESAYGRVMDADIAEESVKKAKYDILQQAGLAMLVQANQSKENILALLS